jgi:hypothetical protein
VKFTVEIVVERVDGKRDMSREKVQELETDTLNIEDQHFYPTTDAGMEVEYKITSATFKKK